MDSPTNSVVKHCQVCYDDLTFTTKTPCNHDEICGVCHLRLRHLHRDRKCPICKADNEMIVVDLSVNKKCYEDYPIYGTELGSNFTYRDDVGMFFPVGHFEETIRPMFGYHCTESGCDYDGTNLQMVPDPQAPPTRAKKPPTPLRGLKDHLRTVHRKALCQLCVDNNRDFIAELPRFSPNGLKNHMNQGDKGSAFRGHPLCEFCKPDRNKSDRFYDLTQIHAHLNKDHYKCHVCESQDLANQFFKDYRSLERHFDNQHFLCLNPQCMQAKFVVFSNELDLRHHERQVHGGVSSSTKINLEFRVRRSNEAERQEAPSEQDFNYGLDGQVFVPDELPTSQDGEGAAAIHPAHAERTAHLMQRAAALRDEDAPEAFPTLAAAAAATNGSGQGPLNAGWSSSQLQSRLSTRNAGEVTEEAFPSLPSAPAPGTVSRLRQMRPKAQNRAMSAAANGWSASGAPAPSAATGYAAPIHSRAPSQQTNLSSDNFPSLGTSSGSAATLYPAANALARQHRGQQVNPNSMDDFPSMGAVNTPSRSTQSNRSRLLSNNARSTVHASAGNTLQGAAQAKTISVEDMKAGLGSAKYKQLKRYTREFAGGDMEPDAYVDHCAALFDRGYGDPDFWDFLPALLDSCPNQGDAKRALGYMDNLRRMQNGAANAEARQPTASASTAAGQTGNWNATPALVAEGPVAVTPSSGWTNAAARGASRMAGGQKTRLVAAPQRVMPGKKKAAWNGSSKATVVRAKATPGSVAVAAANEKPQSGSATKFMAKAQKQSNQQQHQQNQQGSGQNTVKKKKKKQSKNELRQLAFG